MGYDNRTLNKRWGHGAGLVVLILGLVLIGALAGGGPARAAQINCGGCHSLPPSDSDNTCDLTTKSHPAHADSNPSSCTGCHPTPPNNHPTATHNNNANNVEAGVGYSGGDCTSACHSNKSATWGGALDCNSCHYASGATGSYAMSGLHVDAGNTWKHVNSPIKANDTETITCTHCHPDNSADTSTPRGHIGATDTAARGDMSQAFANVTVTGVGYLKGVTQGTGSCVGSCHYNPGDPFGNYTIFFKPGEKKLFGTYQTKNWDDTDLNCNECHSTPSQSSTRGGSLGTNANKRHEAHMFKYKLNPYNFSDGDRNIYCDDCHVTPSINAVRGFRLHSTTGQGGSGIISLPVRSENARVDMRFRNNGIGRDGSNPPDWQPATQTCSNVYCHTIMISGKWTEDACNDCHGMNDGVNVGSGAPGYINWTTAATYPAFEEYAGGGGAHYSHVTFRGYPCRTCHYKGGGDGENPLEHNVGAGTVIRANVNVDVHPDFWFNNQTSVYDWATRSCNNVKCHYGSSQNWDCEPLH